METTFPAGVGEAPKTVTKANSSVKESSKPADKDQEKRPSIAREPSTTDTLKWKKTSSKAATRGAGVSHSGSNSSASTQFPHTHRLSGTQDVVDSPSSSRPTCCSVIPMLLRKLRRRRSQSSKGRSVKRNRDKSDSSAVNTSFRVSDSSGINTSFRGSDSSGINTSFRESEGMLGDLGSRSDRNSSSETSEASEVSAFSGATRREEHTSSKENGRQDNSDLVEILQFKFKYDLKFELLNRRYPSPALHVMDETGKTHDNFMFGFPDRPEGPLPIKTAETGQYLQITNEGDIVLGDSRNGHEFHISYWSTNNNQDLKFMKTKLEGKPYTYLGAHKNSDGRLTVYTRDEPPSWRSPPLALCLRVGQV